MSETTAQLQAADPIRLLRMSEVVQRTGLSRKTIIKRMANGRFPKALPNPDGIYEWREQAIVRFFQEKEREAQRL